jgi:antitoxin component of RelBE/YafQ-DinJ toxin-antitoxin module
MRRVHRHLEGALDVLKEMGLTINDWINQPYDAGLPVKVLTFQPAPEVERDTVIETVRPTVMWKDRLVQLGEVVVGTPVNPEEKIS